MTARIPGLHPIETASLDEIQALQLERLKTSLGHAYNRVPHYKASFDAAGFHPDDLTCLSDLSKVPFLTKADMRANYPFGMLAYPTNTLARVHASSGTTGKPTVVGYTANDISLWADMMARSLYAAGARPGMKVHISYGYGLFTGGLGAHYGAERLGCMVIPMSGGQTEKQVQLIADFEPDVIMVTPSYMLVLADEMDRQGLTREGLTKERCSLRYGVFGAEPWTNEMRASIEARIGLSAVDIYGLSEVIGPGVANECVETKDGLHVWEDHFYPEIIDPETGDVLPDGSFGELVFTSLSKEALPVIRYRTGDLTRLPPGTARSMRRIEKIAGRSDDMMIVRGVNVFPSQIEELILRDSRLSPHYQLELGKDGALDTLSVSVEGAVGAGETMLAQAGAALKSAIKAHIGISADVRVLDKGSVERSVGKAKRVVDKRPKA